MGDLVVTHAPVEGVTVLTMQGARKKNALSIALRDELADALDAIAADDAVRCAVLTGAGDVFSAGFDLGEFADDDPDHQRRLWASSDRFHHTVLGFPLPLIAAVNGPALAGGFDLAVMCDLRVVADSAHFAHVEYAWTEVVYRPLRELVGGSRARELTLTGRRIDAAEALEIGLANAVVAPAQVVEQAVEMAATVAAMPRHIAVQAKAKILAAASISDDTGTLQL